jgi:signal transduction histidine kinase
MTGTHAPEATRMMYRLLRRITWSGVDLHAASWRPTKTRVEPRTSSANRIGRDAQIVRVLLVAMLLAAAIGTQLSQIQARRALEDRFALRATLGASFVSAYTADILAREQAIASAGLAGDTVTALEFHQAVAAFGFEAALLLDSRGRILHIAPPAPEMLGVSVAERYEHLRLALAGQPTVSGAVESAASGQPLVAFAVPFETERGVRVFSGGHHLGHTPLSAYLRSAIPFSAAVAYLVDANGYIVDSNAGSDSSVTSLVESNAGLASAMASGTKGTFVFQGKEQHFTVEDVAGTPLRLILAVPTAQLYAPLIGPAQWVPWILLSLLLVGAAYLLRVLGALHRTGVALRATSQELERSNRELQDFASIASHDLQEPLRKIRAFGDRLATGHAAALDESGQDYLARMTSAAARMQALIDDLLAYSRVASRQEAVHRVSLATVMSEVLVDLEQRLADTHGAVKVIGSLPEVDADPMQLHQLLQNLIGNALKYRRPDVTPEVRVSCVESAAGWTIQISDNGIGFSQDQAARIFAPFQRLHGRGEFEGTGMGLAICRRIVERHGGTIAAHGRPGEGADFVVTLPRTDTDQGIKP